MASASALLCSFCLPLAFTLARTHQPLVKFYAWFKDCGLDISKHRGYGQSACKLYGLVPAPKLSVLAMRLAGLAFIALIILPCTPLVAAAWRAPMLLAALVAYHLYFSQLYCEAHVGAHVTVLVPPALILLALCPALDEHPGGSLNYDFMGNVSRTHVDTATSTAAFTAWMMKIVLTSSYCGAGVCKITHSLRSVAAGGSSWCTGSTLQAFIFEAMFLSNKNTHSSFGLPTPFSYTLQRLHMRFPVALLLPASIGALAFETLAPLLLLAPAHVASVPFGVFGLTFHYGIALLQNIDFLSWWGPAYAFLLADPAAWAGGALFACPADEAALTLSGSLDVAMREAPLRTAFALAYVCMHVLAVLVLRFVPSAEILPFSAFPMFGAPHNLFDANNRKWFWLTEKPHATGTLKNYCFPFCRPQTVQPHEIESLPFKYLLMGHGASEPVSAFHNCEMTPRLSAGLATLRALSNQGKYTFAAGGGTANADELLGLLDELKNAFAEAPRLPAKPASATATATSDDLPTIGQTPSTAAALAVAPSAAATAPLKAAQGAVTRERPIILFDGVCLLCSTFIHFVLDHDAAGLFDFATLQGETGTSLLTQAGLPLDVSTMVLIDSDGVHTRSTAALRVLRQCGMPYALLYAAILLPRPLRDLGYKAVASVRYRLFGKDDGSTCRRMTKAIRARFL